MSIGRNLVLLYGIGWLGMFEDNKGGKDEKLLNIDLI